MAIREQRVLAVSRDHPLAGRASVSLEDLTATAAVKDFVRALGTVVAARRGPDEVTGR